MRVGGKRCSEEGLLNVTSVEGRNYYVVTRLEKQALCFVYLRSRLFCVMSGSHGHIGSVITLNEEQCSRLPTVKVQTLALLNQEGDNWLRRSRHV